MFCGLGLVSAAAAFAPAPVAAPRLRGASRLVACSRARGALPHAALPVCLEAAAA